jgi:hypothetical protein
LAGLVDYAGLFPPAALTMESAVRQYAAYSASDQAWMLGRFVVPAAHLDAFRDAQAPLPDQPEWHLSALVGADVEADVERVHSFNNAMAARAHIDTVEGKATTDDAVTRIADCASGFRAFVEIPVTDFVPLLDAIRDRGLNAEGSHRGSEPRDVPGTGSAAPLHRARLPRERAVQGDGGIASRAARRLPSDLRRGRAERADVRFPERVSHGRIRPRRHDRRRGVGAPPRARPQEDFRFVERDSWGGRSISTDDIHAARDCVALSFGSCSFLEPVDELRAAALLQ